MCGIFSGCFSVAINSVISYNSANYKKYRLAEFTEKLSCPKTMWLASSKGFLVASSHD